MIENDVFPELILDLVKNSRYDVLHDVKFFQINSSNSKSTQIYIIEM